MKTRARVVVYRAPNTKDNGNNRLLGVQDQSGRIRSPRGSLPTRLPHAPRTHAHALVGPPASSHTGVRDVCTLKNRRSEQVRNCHGSLRCPLDQEETLEPRLVGELLVRAPASARHLHHYLYLILYQSDLSFCHQFSAMDIASWRRVELRKKDTRLYNIKTTKQG